MPKHNAYKGNESENTATKKIMSSWLYATSNYSRYGTQVPIMELNLTPAKHVSQTSAVIRLLL